MRRKVETAINDIKTKFRLRIFFYDNDELINELVETFRKLSF
jgi:hypothetical protein